ncbi:MAG: PTS sugar transporter subunit IIA [Asticcacaulis sp.]
MIGLVIVTHGKLAEEFISAMEHVVGPQDAVTAICIGPDDDVARRRQDILDATFANDSGDGVILLTDMFGGTPSNLAISVMEQTRAEVIAGINLPMLIKLASLRKAEPMAACVAHAQEAGRKYITVASYVLSGAS